MPLFMPQDGHTDQFFRDHDGLLYKCTAVFSHVLEDALGCFLPAAILTLSGHSEGVDQSLKGRGEGKRGVKKEDVKKKRERMNWRTV